MRPDRLAENEYLARIEQARRRFQELRSAPQYLGSHSVQIYRIFSAAAYDIQVNNVGFNNRVVEVVFTPDDEGKGLGGVFNLEYQMTDSGVGSLIEVVREDIPPNESGPSTFRFYLSASDAFPNSWARLKFWIYSNASGTFTATLL